MQCIFTVCHYTIKEVWQSKILINIVVLGLLIVGVSYVASEFTYLTVQRVALDFGLSMASLAAVGLAIFWGVGLLSSEVDNRTLYLVLSGPISRRGFLLGKILGMLAILLLNVTIIYLLSVSIYFFLGGSWSNLICWAFCYAFLEAAIVLLMAITLSIVMNRALAIFSTLILFVLGHAISGSLDIYFVQTRPLLHKFIWAYGYFFPDFSKLNIKSFLIYEKSLDLSYLLSAMAYGTIYALALIVLSTLIFSRKELN